LERSWVESDACERLGWSRDRPERYELSVGSGSAAEWDAFVERRMAAPDDEDPLDDLVHAAPTHVRDWMERKARLADGTCAGQPILPLGFLDSAAREASRTTWTIATGRIARDAWPVAHVGLARDLCGARLGELSSRVGRSRSIVSRLHGLHRRLLAEDPDYAEKVEKLARAALACWHGA